MKQIVMVLLAVGLAAALQAQNLDKMNEAERNDTLLRIAKEAMMEYGPDFYRDYAEPEIAHGYVTDDNPRFNIEDSKKYRNRSYYTVKYLYNKEEESFPEGYSAEVFIWADTGRMFKITFGTGLGWSDLDAPQTRGTKEKVKWEKQPPGKFKTTRVTRE